MIPNKNQNSKPIIYQAKSGAIELRGDADKETIWASLEQIANVFERDKSVVSRHIKNIFKSNELQRNSVVAFFATTASDGKVYQVENFNLDVLISVGYRVNSKTATKFRQWATRTLRQYITTGFVVDRSKISKNYDQFLATVAEVKRLMLVGVQINPQDVVSLISAFVDTWLSLAAYDEDAFPVGKLTKKKVELATQQVIENLQAFKAELHKKDLVQEMFAIERNDGALSGIIGNVMQSFAGNELYESVEAKAAHLLYFIVKNHLLLMGINDSDCYDYLSC